LFHHTQVLSLGHMEHLKFVKLYVFV
jgi:hypothetical protein